LPQGISEFKQKMLELQDTINDDEELTTKDAPKKPSRLYSVPLRCVVQVRRSRTDMIRSKDCCRHDHHHHHDNPHHQFSLTILSTVTIRVIFDEAGVTDHAHITVLICRVVRRRAWWS
jgi:hypothetical protein